MAIRQRYGFCHFFRYTLANITKCVKWKIKRASFFEEAVA